MVRQLMVAAFLLLPTLLAGCTATLDGFVYEPEAPPPGPPPFGLGKNGLSLRQKNMVQEHLEFIIPSFDGTPLGTDVWKPAKNGTYPVIAIISPYFEDAKNPGEDNLPQAGTLYRQVIQEFVPRGYAVALVDLRGTRNSGGCLDLGGPNEQRDAATAVDYLGKQPWSNGRVGMIGGSYDGWTQQMAAVHNPEHLAAIVPIAPIADIYHGVGKGGAKYDQWVPFTGYGYNFVYGLGMPYPGVPQVPPEDPTALTSLVPVPGDPRFARLPSQACAVENQVWLDDPSGDYNAWMQERDLRPLAAKATAAMFYTHGFADVNARPDHVDPWYANYGGPKRAFLWQADHFASPDANGRGDWWIEIVRWFDYHLLGFQNNVDATYGTVEVQDSLGRWRLEPTWPPLDAVPVPLPLGPGTLGNASGAAGRAAYRENPFDKGHSFGHKSASLGESGSDTRLVYKSDPLQEALHYAGRPVVRATVETDRSNAFVVVRLYDILPDGSWVLINRGVQSLRHREGLDQPKDASPGARYVIEAAMQPNDHVFQPGHRIGLTLTGADNGYILPPATLATTTVHYGGADPSALVLPVIARSNFTRETWGFQQPEWLGPPPAVS